MMCFGLKKYFINNQPNWQIRNFDILASGFFLDSSMLDQSLRLVFPTIGTYNF